MRSVDVIEDHYGPLTSESYDRVTKSFWAYDSTLEAIGFELAYGRGLATKDRPLKILDLGTGTGNLVKSVSRVLPNRRISWVVVDQSEEMLQKATEKIRRQDVEIKSRIVSLQNLDLSGLSSETFDAVVSSFAIHHLDQTAKKSLFRKVYNLTKPRGIFVFGDRFTEASESHLEVAAAYFSEHGPRPKRTRKLGDVVQYMKGQFKLDGDKPSTEQEQIEWMKEAGWGNVRCPFRSFICGVISGIK